MGTREATSSLIPTLHFATNCNLDDNFVGVNLDANKGVEMVKVNKKDTGGERSMDDEDEDDQNDHRISKVRTYQLDGMHPDSNMMIEFQVDDFKPDFMGELENDCLAFKFNDDLYIYKYRVDNKIKSFKDIKAYPVPKAEMFTVCQDTVYFVTPKGETSQLNQATLEGNKTYDLGSKASSVQAFTLANGTKASAAVLASGIFMTVGTVGKKSDGDKFQNILAVTYSKNQDKLYLLMYIDKSTLTVRAFQIKDDASLVSPQDVMVSVPVPTSVGELKEAKFASVLNKDQSIGFVVVFNGNRCCKLGDQVTDILADSEIFDVVSVRSANNGKVARCLIRSRDSGDALKALNERTYTTVVNVLLK